MHAGSTWRECGSYAACGQCVAAQAILKGELPTHASAACILGDGLLVAALQHHVRGHIRKSEAEATAGGEPHRSTTRNEEAAHTTRHDSRPPSRAQRKRRASRAGRHDPKTAGPATAAHDHAALTITERRLTVTLLAGARAPASDRVRHEGARTVPGTGPQARGVATALVALGAPSRTRTRIARGEHALPTGESS